MEYNKKAFAKLNLYLKVLGKNSNSEYHNIESCAFLIDVYDNIKVIIRDSSIFNCKVTNTFKIPQEKDLTYLISKKFSDKFNKNFNIEIFINKNIPEGTGLGGASSNAGCILRILRDYYKLGDNSEDTLCNIASKIGTDCVFFYKNYKCANLQGKGDTVIESNNVNHNQKLILAIPDFKNYSNESYFNLDIIKKNDFIYLQNNSLFNKQLKNEIKLNWRLSGKGSSQWSFYNDEEINNISLSKIEKQLNCKFILSKSL